MWSNNWDKWPRILEYKLWLENERIPKRSYRRFGRYESNGLFEPVNITGMLWTASTTTQLAEIGYALSADLIEPYT